MRSNSYLVDVLALELRQKGGEALIVSLDADGREDSLDVLGRGGGVATEPEKEESRQVLHFDGLEYFAGQLVVEGLAEPSRCSALCRLGEAHRLMKGEEQER